MSGQCCIRLQHTRIRHRFAFKVGRKATKIIEFVFGVRCTGNRRQTCLSADKHSRSVKARLIPQKKQFFVGLAVLEIELVGKEICVGPKKHIQSGRWVRYIVWALRLLRIRCPNKKCENYPLPP